MTSCSAGAALVCYMVSSVEGEGKIEDEGKITKWWPTFDNSIIIASEQKTLMHSTVNSYVSAVQYRW